MFQPLDATQILSYSAVTALFLIPLALLFRFITDSRALESALKSFESIDALNTKLFVIVLPKVWSLGTPQFFVDPYGFLSSWNDTLKIGCTDCFTGRMRSTKLWFKFRVQANRVLVPFGSAARRTILTDRRFNSMMGYALMVKSMIPLPKTPDNTIKDDSNFVPSIPLAWLFRKVVRPDVMEKYPSMILKDIDRELRSWDARGVLDPFDKLRRLLIIPVLRITLGSEILSDPSRVKKTISGLVAIEEANGLPDFPIKPLMSLWLMVIVLILNPFRACSLIYKKVKRFLNGARLYSLFIKAVEERRSAVHDPQQDILQTLLDDDREGPGIDNGAIAQRLIMALFTAGGSSGSVYPWLQIFLCEHPKWKVQVEKEVQDFFEEHVGNADDPSEEHSFERVLNSLSQLDLSTWENSLPVLEKCLRETLRLVLINAVPRMNVGEPLDLSPNTTGYADWVGLFKKLNMGDEWLEWIGNDTTVIREGFVLYLTSDAHFDKTIYPDPFQFNPARDYSDEPTDFLGWGAGLHTCTGQRLAKIMIKVVTVILMNRFELGLADKVPSEFGSGNDGRSVPKYRLFGIGKPERKVMLRYRLKNAKMV